MPELSEEVLGWASRNAVLPRLATVCFLMVIALILRTITDSGLSAASRRGPDTGALAATTGAARAEAPG